MFEHILILVCSSQQQSAKVYNALEQKTIAYCFANDRRRVIYY